jgi:hypothetical protein
MATRIDPDLFSRIMALPTAERLDMLELAGSANMEPERLGKMVKDLSRYPVDPGESGTIKSA